MNEPVKPEDVTKDTFPKELKRNVLDGLPTYLKDPEMYKKIRKASYDIMGSLCSHSEVVEWATCVKCQVKARDHADFLRKLGFTSPAQYFAWRKTHEHIERRVKLR